MTEDQLRAAGQSLGLANAKDLSVDELEKALKQTISTSAAKVESKPETPKHDKDRVWFKLMPDQKAAGDAPVFAGLQGQTIMVHRNTWVPLPKKYLPCFRDAVETIVTTLKDGTTRTSDVPRYNFQIQPLTNVNTPPDDGKFLEDGF